MAGKKKNPNAKYALIGLIVALVACVATGLLASANGLVGLGMFNLSPEQTDGLDLALQISAALLAIGLLSYAILSPDTIRRFFSGRQARYGSNSLVLTLAFVGILFVGNYLIFNNPGLLGEPWDFTEDSSNTLAPETLTVLSALPEKVTATAFYTNNLNPASAEELLQKFKANSNGKFNYTFVNPDLDPIAAREAGITGDGKILLQMGATREVASFVSESELVRTLIRVISPEPRAVYFLEGHGEAGVGGVSGDRAMSIAASTMESKNYTVNSINLLSASSIPEDAEVIIIAGPQKPLSREEVNLLKKYVDAGGALLIMQDPPFFTEFGDAQDPIAQYLQTDWGIVLNNDLIFDFSSQQPLNAISAGANVHPITQNLSANYAVIMPQARSISTDLPPSQDVIVTPLMYTAANSWGETALDESSEEYQFDEGVDTLGPLNMAVAGENITTGGRVVVFGNSYFAIDGNFDVYGNGNMFINSVDWAAEQDDLPGITTRPPTDRVFTPPSQIGFLILMLVAIIVVPGMVVFSGVSAWISRRKRG
jgi:ABC-type uncharacterized transport system involved in gliding motility auxiliary subunit